MLANPTPTGQLSGQGTAFLHRGASDAHGPTSIAASPLADARPENPTKTCCSGCGSIIAFQPPEPGEPVGVWLCKNCGAVYYGDDAEDAAASALGVVRTVQGKSNPLLASVRAAVEARTGSVPPEYVVRLVCSLAGGAYTGEERRTDKRYRICVPVVAVPLGLDFRVAGQPVRMTTMNVSLGGAALVHTRFADAPYYALDFTVAGMEPVQVLLEVVRVRNFGPIYEVAGRFINRLNQTPPPAAKRADATTPD